jgi:hypothetical protein
MSILPKLNVKEFNLYSRIQFITCEIDHMLRITFTRRDFINDNKQMLWVRDWDWSYGLYEVTSNQQTERVALHKFTIKIINDLYSNNICSIIIKSIGNI